MKTVLITGASHGIGSAAALKFAKKGYRVIINYNKSEDAAQSLCESIKISGSDAHCIKCDVSDSAQVEKMFEEIKNKFGGVDVLINNAGISKTALLNDTSEADWDEIFGVNVKGVFLCTRAALPYMINKKSGKIVNVSSVWGICGSSMEAAYSASKAAVIGFTKALAKEVGPSGICVNCVAPGVIDTNMNACYDKETMIDLAEMTPLGRIGTAKEVAESVYFLSCEKSDFVTGQVISPNGGFVI